METSGKKVYVTGRKQSESSENKGLKVRFSVNGVTVYFFAEKNGCNVCIYVYVAECCVWCE